MARDSKVSGLASELLFFPAHSFLWAWASPALQPVCPQQVLLFLETNSFVKRLLPSSGVLREMTLESGSWYLSITCKITPSKQTACSKVSLQAKSVCVCVCVHESMYGSAQQVNTDVKKEVMPKTKQSVF